MLVKGRLRGSLLVLVVAAVACQVMKERRRGSSASLCLIIILAAYTQYTAQQQLTTGARQELAAETDAAVQAPTVHLRQPGIGLHASAPPTPPVYDAFSSKPTRSRGALPEQPATRGSGAGLQVQHRQRVPVTAVVLMSAVMSLMSCLGVVPYFFFNKLSKPWAGLANAVASGVMLAASFGLLAEGAPYGGTYLITGMLLGVVFVKLSQEHLEQYEVDSFEQLAGADARKVILFLAVMAVHAVGEGGGVGVSFAGDRGWAQGTLVTLAIGLHNVPEGLAVATVMAAKGTPPRRALLWTALTALPQALVAPPAFVFVDAFKALLPLALGFAAGCMIWIVLAELLPDALEAVEPEQVATFTTGSAAWLQGLSIFIGNLETPAGTLASPFGDYYSVLPLGLWPVLLHMLPVCILPGLLTDIAVRVRWTRPLVLSAACGLLLTSSALSWLGLLWRGQSRLMAAVVLPLTGAVAAAGLWSHLRKSRGAASAAGHAESIADSCNGVCSPLAAAGRCNEALTASCMDHARARVVQPSPLVLVAPSAAYAGANGTHIRHPGVRVSEQQLQHPQQVQQWQHQSISCNGNQQHHLEHNKQDGNHSSFSGWLPQPTAGQPRCQSGSNGAAAAAVADSPAAAWDAASTVSSCSSCSSSGRQQELQMQPPADRPHRVAKGYLNGPLIHSSSPLPLPGSGDLLLPVTAAPGGVDVWGSSQSYGKGHGGLSIGGGGSSSRAVLRACWMAIAGAAGSGVPVGLQLASAITTSQDGISHLILPMSLQGCLSAAACMGLLLPVMSSQRRLISVGAGALSSVPVLVAVAVLLAQPGWAQQGGAHGAAESLQGLVAGFNVFVLLVLVLPMARQWNVQKASAGLWCGSAVALLLCVFRLLLCMGTPYCLHVGSSLA